MREVGTGDVLKLNKKFSRTQNTMLMETPWRLARVSESVIRNVIAGFGVPILKQFTISIFQGRKQTQRSTNRI